MTIIEGITLVLVLILALVLGRQAIVAIRRKVQAKPREDLIASGNCGANGSNLKWTLSRDGLLTISGKGAMADYTALQNAPWYDEQGCKVKSVVIGNGVTAIGNAAFWDCEGLTGSVFIPKGVTDIGENVFDCCSQLTAINVDPANPEYSSIDGILANRLGDFIIRCPEGKTGTVTIPKGVTGIEMYAFSGCSLLTGSINIPEGLTDIGNSAFDGCSGLTKFVVDPDNPEYSSLDGILYNKDRTNLVKCPGGKTGTLTIPEGVTDISDKAFENCTGLTGTLTIPKTVTDIGWNAFSGCAGFTGQLILPDSLTFIGDYAFEDCNGFTGAVTIPAFVTVGDGIFDFCSGLTDIHVDHESTVFSSIDGILYTSDATFLIKCPEGKTGTVTIPESVNKIESEAFENCTKIDTIIVKRTIPPDIEPDTFDKAAIKGITLVVPKGAGKAYAKAAIWNTFRITEAMQ